MCTAGIQLPQRPPLFFYFSLRLVPSLATRVLQIPEMAIRLCSSIQAYTHRSSTPLFSLCVCFSLFWQAVRLDTLQPLLLPCVPLGCCRPFPPVAGVFLLLPISCCSSTHTLRCYPAALAPPAQQCSCPVAQHCCCRATRGLRPRSCYCFMCFFFFAAGPLLLLLILESLLESPASVVFKRKCARRVQNLQRAHP